MMTPQTAVFVCGNCSRRIELPDCLEVHLETGPRGIATGYVIIVHSCTCRVDDPSMVGPDGQLTTRQVGTPIAFISLFGSGKPPLPWTASPTGEQAPEWTRRKAEEVDKLVAKWSWELSQVASGDEFIEWLERS